MFTTQKRFPSAASGWRAWGPTTSRPWRCDQERLTDLATDFFGLGLFTANAAFDYSPKSARWKASRPGYLSEAMSGYALAYCADLRDEKIRPGAEHSSLIRGSSCAGNAPHPQRTHTNCRPADRSSREYSKRRYVGSAGSCCRSGTRSRYAERLPKMRLNKPPRSPRGWPGQRWAAGTPRKTCSTCWPHPAHVAFPQVRHLTA